MRNKPILLFNDECSVCRHIAGWVQRSAQTKTGEVSIIALPIGDDPQRLRALNPGLDIWDAYATVHVLMPDASMKTGGEAVAEVLRNLPNTHWFAWIFAVSVFGFRPFQALLNLAYVVLADMRPTLGCESCGEPSPLLRPLHWIVKLLRTGHVISRPHFSPRPAPRQVPLEPRLQRQRI
jgi:predicted DCC family thiol-disulfide oxidoreductase YuxK